MNVVELVMRCEEVVKIELSDEDMERVRTFGDSYAAVSKKRKLTPYVVPTTQIGTDRLPRNRYIETIVVARTLNIQSEHARDEAPLSWDLQHSLREIAEGKTLPGRQVFAQLREEYDMRG